MKTSELIGAQLDWAVAKAKFGNSSAFSGSDIAGWAKINKPSTDWSQGGPIMDREEIDTYCHERNSPFGWHAEITGTKFKGRGQTRLIAAMRCYVASNLGDEVTIPKELENV